MTDRDGGRACGAIWYHDSGGRDTIYGLACGDLLVFTSGPTLSRHNEP